MRFDSKKYKQYFPVNENRSETIDNKNLDYWDKYRKIPQVAGAEKKMMNFLAHEFIFKITLKNPNYEIIKNILANKYIRDGIIKDYYKEDIYSVLETKNSKIKFCLLSDIFKKLENFRDGEIFTFKRLGKCHLMSMVLSKRIKFDNQVVTGYVSGTCDESKFLHSWIELKIMDSEAVIDYTLNAVMSKKDYYEIAGVDEKNLTKISKQQILDDEKTIQKTVGDNLGLKEYLYCHDQVMQDLSKAISGGSGKE